MDAEDPAARRPAEPPPARRSLVVDRPALATALAVAVVVAIHAIVCLAIIAAVDPDIDDPVAYQVVSVHLPELAWAALVTGRAIAWRRWSPFWLGASAGAVVVGSFMLAFVILIARIDAKGIPMAVAISSWVLLAIAILVALSIRAFSAHADPPIDADDSSARAAQAGGVTGARGVERPSVDSHAHGDAPAVPPSSSEPSGREGEGEGDPTAPLTS
jgi:hypothetical protein